MEPTKKLKIDNKESVTAQEMQKVQKLATKGAKYLAESDSPALKFKLISQRKKARQSLMTLPHGDVDLPIFMPVGTKGTIKGLTSEEMHQINCKLLLANTYHLASKPKTPYLDSFGGLHKFMNWSGNILTDSGGFQMVSLSKLCKVDENGVEFKHPNTGEMLMLRPEDSIQAQNEIGSDIMMALDDVVSSTTEGPRMSEANERTIRWIQRCFQAHQKPQVQNLFPIVQGGLDKQLRLRCIEELIKSDAPGYAIGGLSGGEEKTSFVEIVDYTANLLPKNKPRYLMGVGHPEDLVICVCLGVDMFDCVYPTRTARFGTAFSKHGNLRLKQAKYKDDFRPIDEDCDCEVCQNYTRAFLSSVVTKEEVGGHLLSKHNIHFLLNLMRRMQEAISEDRLDSFVRQFYRDWYHHEQKLPEFIVKGLELAGISSEGIFDDQPGSENK